VNEDKHIGREKAPKGVHAFGKKVAPDHEVHESMDKGRPRNHRLLESLILRRVNVRILEKASHR
jgi:hypothetical protein